MDYWSFNRKDENYGMKLKWISLKRCAEFFPIYLDVTTAWPFPKFDEVKIRRKNEKNMGLRSISILVETSVYYNDDGS